MKHLWLTLVALLSLGLVSCSSNSEPDMNQSDAEVDISAESEPVRDVAGEAAFLEAVYSTVPEESKNAKNEAAVLDLGYSLCEVAEAEGITTGEAAQMHIDLLDPNSEGWMLNMSVALLAGKASGEILCP